MPFSVCSVDMGISTGTKLGPYVVQDTLGRGGMGIVYRATDVRLGRDVAIKVLSENFTSDPERLARFEREARVLASLNHPRIANIYDVERTGSEPFLVLEYVPGDTLAESMARHRLDVEDSLQIMLQVAEALEAAHEAGVIHRDLKPANIKITPDGRVKVLDFGLAKSLRGEISTPQKSDSLSPTMTAVTNAGMLLGTAAYMSPEQARGLPLDKRTDIWSFGMVLFECLTGHRFCQGESIPDILSSVLNKAPDWDSLPAETPAAIRKLLQRCIERDRTRRLRDMGEARILIGDCLTKPAETSELTVSSRKAASRRVIVWLSAGALGLMLLGAAWISWRAARPARPSVMQFTVDLGSIPELTRPQAANVIVSSDGSRLVYRGRGPDGIVLYTRPFDEQEAVALAGTEGAENPFFSPNGEWIGFFAGGKLKKIPTKGGTASVLCDAPSTRGGSWGDDGNIIAALSNGAGLSRIPSEGGPVHQLTHLRSGEVTHRWPQVLPGTEAVLFTANTAIGGGFDDATIEFQSLRNGERKTLVRGGHYGRYSASGHLLFVRRRVMYAAPLDLRRMQLTTSPVPVLEEVRSSPVLGSAQMDVSRTGTLVYVNSLPEHGRIAALALTGRISYLSNAAAYFNTVRSSPDGKRLVVDLVENGNLDVWVYEPGRNTINRLTSTHGTDAWPVWTPDGKYLIFGSARHGGVENLYCMRADGAGEPFRLLESANLQVPESVSLDGTQLIYQEKTAQTGADVWTVRIADLASGRPKVGRPERLLGTEADERDAEISPDGRWLAYRSTESGNLHVYVRRFPVGGKWRISTDPAGPPRWSRNRRELFYGTAAGMLITDYSTTEDTFIPGKTRLQTAYKGLNNLSYDIVPGLDSIVLLERQGSSQQSAVLILNFFEKIRRRLETESNRAR
jgi:serine/threonine protein kinase/Tol biopolymer transport system component